MKKFILITMIASGLVWGDAQSDEEKLARIKKELNIQEPTPQEKKLQALRDELGIEYKLPEKKPTLLDKTIETVKKEATIDFSLERNIRDIETLLDVDLGLDFELEEGESWGMPSVFGFNKKVDRSVFGSELLGDVRHTGSTFYKGFKTSGESAEFFSGMMYYNSKMYNTMFGLFDESPFNLFEEEEETSVFDLFKEGNSVMDWFD